MVEEKGAEAVKAQEAAQAPEPTMDELRTRISQLEGDVETAKGEAKAHQKFGEKTRAELERQRGLDDKVSKMENRLTIVTDMLAETLDRTSIEESIEEKPQKRRSDEYLSRLERTNAEKAEADRQSEQAYFQKKAAEADTLLRAAGLEMDKSPETKDAYIQFLLGNPDVGLEEVRRVVSSRTEAKKPDAEEAVEERARKMLEERGQLDTDTGSPSGSGRVFSTSEIDTMPSEEYRKNFPNGLPDIQKAINEGRIR